MRVGLLTADELTQMAVLVQRLGALIAGAQERARALERGAVAPELQKRVRVRRPPRPNVLTCRWGDCTAEMIVGIRGPLPEVCQAHKKLRATFKLDGRPLPLRPTADRQIAAALNPASAAGQGPIPRSRLLDRYRERTGRRP